MQLGARRKLIRDEMQRRNISSDEEDGIVKWVQGALSLRVLDSLASQFSPELITKIERALRNQEKNEDALAPIRKEILKVVGKDRLEAEADRLFPGVLDQILKGRASEIEDGPSF
jgi:hypothetical protein